MSMRRSTALVTVQNPSFGGSSFNSITHAQLFKGYAPKPINFGVKMAQLFSSEIGGHLINKKFHYLTLAKGNYYQLPPGHSEYEWMLQGDADVDFEATELLVAADAQVGKANQRFNFTLNRDWLHEPVLLKCEKDDAPLIKIIGYPVARGVGSFQYEGVLQTGDATAFIEAEYFEPGRTFIDVSTQISDEENGKQGGDQYGDMWKLMSIIGRYGRKATFTDKFIRLELAGKKGEYKVAGQTRNDGAVSKGFIYQQKYTAQTNSGEAKIIQAGTFITNVEARLEERVIKDREYACEWGQIEDTFDVDTDYRITSGPGWRQIVKEGHYRPHFGDFTLTDIYEYTAEIFMTRRAIKERDIIFAGGEAFIEYMHRLMAREATAYQTLDTIHIRKLGAGKFHDNELEIGSQFTVMKFPMGYTVRLMHDPIKDDRKLFKAKIPGTQRNIESMCADIFDFGKTDAKPTDGYASDNITMVMEEGYEHYYHVNNVYDFLGGKANGEKVAVDSRTAKIVRETSGSLCVWDVSRVGRLQYVVAG